MTITFEIPGEPRGKGRPRFQRRGDYVHTYTPDRTASYENLVAVMYYNAARNANQDGLKLEGPIAMDAYIYFDIPKSKSKKVREAMLRGEIMPTIKCDIDNVIKIVMDGLNKVAFDDDKQVVDLTAHKRYSDQPRVIISLKEMKGDT